MVLETWLQPALSSDATHVIDDDFTMLIYTMHHHFSGYGTSVALMRCSLPVEYMIFCTTSCPSTKYDELLVVATIESCTPIPRNIFVLARVRIMSFQATLFPVLVFDMPLWEDSLP